MGGMEPGEDGQIGPVDNIDAGDQPEAMTASKQSEPKQQSKLQGSFESHKSKYGLLKERF
jgi:hypothetical protein